MIRQVEPLHRDLSAALAVEDARNPELVAAKKQVAHRSLASERNANKRQSTHG
jgi:hypothetical protein